MPNFHIDPNSPVPRYYQIRENLIELIRSGELAPGELIPSERELSEHYSVNRLTVRQAVTELVHEGLLRRQQGVGTFVQEQKITHDMPGLMGFTERMRNAGYTPDSKIISLSRQTAPRSAAQMLSITLDSLVIKIVRLRLVDGEPMMIETCYLRDDCAPDLEIEHFEESQSLYALLANRYGIQLVEADEVLEPVILTSYEAELLATEPGRPAMLIEGVVYSSNREPIEFTKTLVRGDKSRFYFRLHRQGSTIAES
jgi:GntR family transcriptional regulator